MFMLKERRERRVRVYVRVKWLFFCCSGGEREGEKRKQRQSFAVYVCMQVTMKSPAAFVCRELSLSLLSYISCLRLSTLFLDDICFLSNMMMINSPPSQPSTQSDSAKRLRLTIPRNNKNDLLIPSNTISPEKIDEKNNHIQKQSLDCNNTMTTMKQQLSSSIDNENDTTLLTTTTTTTTVEVKVKTTKTSSSSSRKRKLNVIDETNNNNINDNSSKQQQQPVNKKKVIYRTQLKRERQKGNSISISLSRARAHACGIPEG
jgi:hypothetical protein